MKLIAWDTSSKAGTIVAMEWDPAANMSPLSGLRLVAEFSLNVDSTHSERLLWGIHQVLESARWKLEEIDVFGVGTGPGSFTGLRIGITTARTLAHTLNKPLVGVSSLAALVRPVARYYSQKEFNFSTLVVAVTDACKGEVFSLWGHASLVQECVVRPDSGMSGLWNKEVEEKVIQPEVLMQVIRTYTDQNISNQNESFRWIAVGEGRRRYSDIWNTLDPAYELTAPLPYLDHVQGRYLGHLVWEAFQAKLARDSLNIHPQYLRASDAELKLKAGLLQASPTRG